MTSTVRIKFNTDHDLDGESAPVSHDDSNPTNANAEIVDGMQNLDDADDADDAEVDGQEDGNEQDGVEDDDHGDGNEQGDGEDDEDKDCGVAGEAVRLSVYLLYLAYSQSLFGQHRGRCNVCCNTSERCKHSDASKRCNSSQRCSPGVSSCCNAST